jgi:3-methyladenine DNA glycosylase AlkD
MAARRTASRDSTRPITAAGLRKQLRADASAEDARILQRFFKTAPGEYGEGDVFLGVRVPAMRRICRDCGDGVTLATIARLLRSRVHEDRSLALMLLVRAFEQADHRGRREIYDLYLASTASINNWDLVDQSAGPIVGGWLYERSRAPLLRLARSSSLWERRIAIVATHHFIRRGDLDETFRIADLLMPDRHDLIHKAVGWMLREAGKRDGAALRTYLRERYRTMPRTMLRYAIERFPEVERRRYLKGGV